MIKEQCNNCKYRTSEECKKVTEFDGSECPNYFDIHKESQSQDRSEYSESEGEPAHYSAQEPVVITSEYLQEHTSINGWLAFFLFVVGLGGVINALSSFISFDVSDYAGSYILGSIDIFTGVACLFMAAYTIYSFIKRQPNAVFVAKIYVAIVFVTNLILIMSSVLESDHDTASGSTVGTTVGGLFWGIIWFLYLCNSKQVARVIPKEFRRRKKFDYYLLGAIVLIPIILFLISLFQLAHININLQAARIEYSTLEPGEYTDGLTVVTPPQNFTCSVQHIKNLNNRDVAFLSLESPYSNITIASDFDKDRSRKNFDHYWNGWKDPELKLYTESIEWDKDGTINGNPYHYRLTKYDNGTIQLAWRFIIVYNKKHGKVAVINAYDGFPNDEFGEDAYMEQLLSSIRFE